MISLLTSLYRQSLIAQKNSLQFQSLNNSSAIRAMAMSNPSFGSCDFDRANYLQMQNLNNQTQLMAINAELESLNKYTMNYLA